ncbi:alpha/beta hydrolase [Solimonas sp. K1W22B-7]|uniref:alpha/beta fold hydrolase n=1 Tax=Solimonas sp. K1W22B-7 TaxID=2303331 RepID=UPI000E32F364|nr:alpha/beta hydrolase [Solimonas sp. K1W22B-7]AXQ28551.1 alpha/beta hydrolase [Solimonas sp. K1W22B-7]
MVQTKSTIPIDFDDVGAGDPALLCLPGWCVDRGPFDGLVSACSRTRRVLSMDWRGHGRSGPSPGDFGESALVEDAEAVIRESGAERVVPVAMSHSGWVAIELRRRLGGRIPAIVLLDWLVLDPPPPFLGALAALQDPATWQATRDQLFGMWLHGVDQPEIIRLVREGMGAYGAGMWARAGREIGNAYRREGNPLKALAALDPPLPALHLYAQPEDPGFLQAQESFAATHPWFTVRRLKARSHFPTMEVPEDMARAIESFLGRGGFAAQGGRS